MIFYIAHRGNLYGRHPERENNPTYINQALYQGFHCEIDVWYDEEKGFSLGHDMPNYPIDLEFLQDPRLWCHAKNNGAFLEMLRYPDIVCFCHDQDEYALTSDGYLWTWSHTEHNNKCIVMYPEMSNTLDLNNIAGICSDYIGGFNK